MGAVIGLVGGIGLLLVYRTLVGVPPSRRLTRGGALAELLARAGYPRSALPSLVAAAIALGALAGATVGSLTGLAALGFGAAAAGVVAPVLFLRRRARKRRERLRPLWPDVVDHICAAIRVGMPLPDALAALGERGPAPLRPAFCAFADEYRSGGDFTLAARRLQEQLADPCADRIVTALLLARDVGGSDVGRLLRSLGEYLRADLAVRGELTSRQSWVVNGARVAAIAPWAVLALLATRPGAIAAYSTAAGGAVLLVGAAASVCAYTIMTRIGRLPEDKRVLR